MAVSLVYWDGVRYDSIGVSVSIVKQAESGLEGWRGPGRGYQDVSIESSSRIGDGHG